MSVFSQELQEKIKHYLGRYETKRSAILPILHAIQDECEWIKPEHFEGLEKEFDLLRVQVREVATFYSMYRLEEPKKFRILFCDNLVCTTMGAKKTMEKIEHVLEGYEKKGKDCPFSLQGVPCLGVCDGAPAMLVNKDRYLKVHPGNVVEFLKAYDSNVSHVQDV